MKLRIKGNSIRFRIQQQELIDLSQKGYIQEAITFGSLPDKKLAFRVETSLEEEALAVDFSHQCICLKVPRAIVVEMAETDRVGVAGDQKMGENELLSMLIEKDFKCLTHRAEDFDAFAHPDAASGHTC